MVLWVLKYSLIDILTLGIEDINIVAGSIISARFSESSNGSFIFVESYDDVDTNDAQADNALKAHFRIRLAELQPAHWPENDEDDPELVLLENQRAHNVESEYWAVKNFGSKIEFTSAYQCAFPC